MSPQEIASERRYEKMLLLRQIDACKTTRERIWLLARLRSGEHPAQTVALDELLGDGLLKVRLAHMARWSPVKEPALYRAHRPRRRDATLPHWAQEES